MSLTAKEKSGCIMALALGPPMMIAGVMWRGFVLAKLWLWFLVPLGVAPLGIAQAIGISALVSMLTHQAQKTEKTDESLNDLLFKGAIRLALDPAIYLLCGWIIKEVSS